MRLEPELGGERLVVVKESGQGPGPAGPWGHGDRIKD